MNKIHYEKTVAEVYTRHTKNDLRQNQSLDFDDLIMTTINII